MSRSKQNADQNHDVVLAEAFQHAVKLAVLPDGLEELADPAESVESAESAAEEQELHRVYIIWPFRHISHKTETSSAELAIAAFVQLMRMRHKSFYAIGVGWEINGRLKKYLDFSSGTLHELE